MTGATVLEAVDGYWRGSFSAMASSCELLMEVDSEAIACTLLDIAHQETCRIEQKFSRYRNDNIIFQINHSPGTAVKVDEEVAALLDYAASCYELSDGMFDITSGVLREVWRFDGSDNVPGGEQVAAVLPRVGWNRLKWQKPYLTLAEGMEIDFGGIGKEYAVDRTAILLQQQTRESILINYGGDIYVTGPRKDGSGWLIGVENPQHSDNNKAESIKEYMLSNGGLATSGDARRFLLKDGLRYSHILNPKTGWPVCDAPHSITVAAETCTDAGILSTMAMLQGKDAEKFLDEQGVTYWCIR